MQGLWVRLHRDSASREASGYESACHFALTMGNASLGMMARLLKVSHVAVLQWVKKDAQRITDILGGAKSIMVDEMQYFVNGKKTKFGSGKPLMLCQSEGSPGNWVGVILER